MKATKHLATGWSKTLLLTLFTMVSVFLANTRVNAQFCLDRQVNLVDVFSGLGNDPNVVGSPSANNTITISASGVVSGAGFRTPDAVNFTNMPTASDKPQYGWAYIPGSTDPVFVTVFTWRVGPKPNLSSNGFNNFWAEVSATCSGFQSSYLLAGLQYKSPQGSSTVSSWDVKRAKVVTATAGSNCETPAGMQIIEWQSMSNTQNNEAYAVAILQGRYQVSSSARAYARSSNTCCYYKSPNDVTFGIECVPDAQCSVDDPTVIGTQCNTTYPVTLKIAEYEAGTKYQNNTYIDGIGRQITETYTIAWYRYSGGNAASGTNLGTGWTLSYTPVPGTSVTPIISKTQSYQNYSGNIVSQNCASGAVTPQITNTVVTFTPQVTNPNCFGGVATINVSTAGSYTYKLGGSAGTPVTPPFTVGESGSYTLYALDPISGCDTSKSFTVTIPSKVTKPTVTVNPPTCAASGTASVTNYNAAFTYIFSPAGPAVGAGGVISGFATGTSYTVTAKNSSDCSSDASDAFTILAKLPTPNKPTVSVVAPTCAANGSASISNYSGSLTYTFSPAGPSVDGSGNITGATLGTSYTVTAKNSDNCTSDASDAFTILAKLPTPNKPTVSVVAPTCAANGSASISNYSGSLTYTFSPAGPSVDGSGNITGATLGTSYTVTAKNSDNCTSDASDAFTILAKLPTPNKPTVSVVAPTCAANGSASISNYSGSLTYTFSPAGPSVDGSGNITGATLGTSYTVTAKNSDNCTSDASDAFTILAKLPTPNKPTVSVVAPTCAANGSASISNYSGSLTYTFSPAGPSVDGSGNITGATLGTSYTVTAKNSDNCTSDASDAFTILAKLPTPNKPTVSVVAPTCAANGSASISNYSGSLTYTFSPAGPSVDGSGNITGATLGTSYTVTAKNSDNCTSDASDAFTILAKLPTPNKPTVSVVAPTCAANGSASISNYSGSLTYTFSPAGPSVDGSGNITGATLGTSYTVTAKNSDNCTSDASDAFTILAKLPTPNKPTVSVVAPTCAANGSASISNYSGSLTYTFSPAGPSVDGSGNITGATLGTSYTVTAKNSDNCTSDASDAFTILAKLPTPNKPTITADKVVCLGTKTTLSGSPSGGTWTLVSGGGSLDGNVYTAPLSVSEVAAVISYSVTNGDGCSNDNQVTVQFADCSNFCTYSQGYYGNPGGKSCKVIPGSEPGSYTTAQESTIERIRRAFAAYKAATPGNPTSVKFGVGDNSFNLRESDLDDKYAVKSKLGEIEKIFALLPGGGSAIVINAKSGGGWNSTNGAEPGGPLKTQPNNSVGKINNALLTQTVAMWLNMWASQNDLGDWVMPATFSTYDAQACGSSIPASGATENPFTTPVELRRTKMLNGESVFTVADLLRLADTALAGRPLPAGVTGSMIHGMLGTLVNAFHGCKTFAGVPEGLSGGARIEFGGPAITTTAEVIVKEEPKSDIVVKAFPNPYVDQVTFNITVKNAGKGSLVLYNAIGQKVANVFEGDMQANSTQTIRYSVPVSQRKSLVYVFRQNGNTNTGRLVSGK